MVDYVSPSLEINAFHCPLCNAYAQMISSKPWLAEFLGKLGYAEEYYVTVKCCAHCSMLSIWYMGRMIYPDSTIAPTPNPDMPDDVLCIYKEAATISVKSPRAAAALLRLAIQHLCVYLGERGNNINNDIASLVSKGLPEKIQKALDSIRVIGNNAVHPGQIDINDSPEIVTSLFLLTNVIVEYMISNEKKINSIYGSLPHAAQNAINRRDAP